MAFLTAPLNTLPIVRTLRACADDPMWADHAEVSKKLLIAAADEIDKLRIELCEAQWAASEACAELSTLYGGDKTYAVRDAVLACTRLVDAQHRIGNYFNQ